MLNDREEKTIPSRLLRKFNRKEKMSDVYLGEDHYKNIAITEINEAINFCMINKLSKDKIKKIEKALDYLCSGVLYDSEILENEHNI